MNWFYWCKRSCRYAVVLLRKNISTQYWPRWRLNFRIRGGQCLIQLVIFHVPHFFLKQLLCFFLCSLLVFCWLRVWCGRSTQFLRAGRFVYFRCWIFVLRVGCSVPPILLLSFWRLHEWLRFVIRQNVNCSLIYLPFPFACLWACAPDRIFYRSTQSVAGFPF